MKKTFVLLMVLTLLFTLALVPTASAKTVETPSGYTAKDIESGDVTVGNGRYHIYGTRTDTTHAITVSAGAEAEIILDDVQIVLGDEDEDRHPAIALGSNAKVTLKLAGNNYLVGGDHKACINVPGGAKLTITSYAGDGKTNGSLWAVANPNYIVNGRGDVGCGPAAIGANGMMGYTSDSTLGEIVINGGTIRATGATGGAGIGGAGFSRTGSITINGGHISAGVDSTSVYASGAAIGGGADGDGPNIIINGGFVEASDPYNAASIGGGYHGQNFGQIAINGGTVIASKIGSGTDSAGTAVYPGSVTITGGSVHAPSGVTNPTNGSEAVFLREYMPEHAVNGAPLVAANIGSDYSYGLKDVVIYNGKVCFWLPEGVTANPKVTSYTVSFNAGGANGSMASVQAYMEYKLPVHGFTNKEDMLFVGWSYSENGPIIKDKTIQVTEDITLYAVWYSAEILFTADGVSEYTNLNNLSGLIWNYGKENSVYVRLLKDVDIGSFSIPNGADVTLDLNGHTINGFLSLENTKLRIVDTTDHAGSIINNNGTAIRLSSGSELTVEAGSISGSGAIDGIVAYDGENCSVVIRDEAVVQGILIGSGSHLTVYGGTIKSEDAIILSKGAEAEIFDGTFIGSVSNSGTMTIHGGTFTTITDGMSTIYNNGALTIHGGMMNSGWACAINNRSNLTITGGSFTAGSRGTVCFATNAVTADFTDYAQQEGVALYTYSDMDVDGKVLLAPGYAVMKNGVPVENMKGWTEGYVIGMLPTHDITVTPAEGGSIGVNKTVAAPGMSVSLILEADDDYELVGFEIKDADGAAVAYTGTDGEYTFSMPDKDVTVSASFKLIHEHDWAYVQQGENTIACVCNNNDGKCPNGNDGGKVILTAESKTYDGAAAEVKVENSLITGETVEPIMTDLAANTTLTGTPADAGSYRASVTVGGVTASVDFTISQRSIADAALTVTSSHVYNGEAHTPAVTLTVNGMMLTAADYDLDCANNIAAGTASVTATGKGNYTDSVSATFTIAKAAGETSVSIAGWTYGEAANAPIPVSATNGTDAVTYIYTGTDNSGTAYGPSAEAPVDAGGYTVTATFAANANYAEATAKADFIVAKAQMAAPIGLTAVYGNVLSSVTLPAGFTWVEPTAPVGEAGENGHLANFVGDANYEAAQNMVVQVTVNQSQTEMTAAADKTDYTYGEKISVTVTTAATGSSSPFSLRRLAAPAAGQVALYNGSEQITEPLTAGSGETVIFTLDTVEDGFVLGSYTLTAKYTASDNMDAQEVNFTFNVAFAEDTPENDAALSGNCNEEGWYGEDPTLIAPEGGQISLDYGPEATWSNHLTLPTEEGEHTYTYYVKDENGLISEKTVTVMVDKSAPEVVDILVEVSTNGAEIIVTATDELSGVQGMNLEQGSGKEKLTVTDNGEGGFTVSGMEPGKSYDLTLTVRDKVGHQTTVTITVTAAQLPQTGDSSNLILWMMMLGLASCELLCLRRRVN